MPYNKKMLVVKCPVVMKGQYELIIYGLLALMLSEKTGYSWKIITLNNYCQDGTIKCDSFAKVSNQNKLLCWLK